jgi:hypothetical protein
MTIQHVDPKNEINIDYSMYESESFGSKKGQLRMHEEKKQIRILQQLVKLVFEFEKMYI